MMSGWARIVSCGSLPRRRPAAPADSAGRLLRYSPSTGEAEVLAREFWFTNGVALAADESYVLVADSIRMALLKYWLKVGGVHG
jgi:sugar lactone lactonase YvrE